MHRPPRLTPTPPLSSILPQSLPTDPVMELNFNHFLVKVPEGMEHETVRAGFLMHLTESETTARQDIEQALERLERDENDCWLEHPGPYDEVIDLSSPESWEEKNAHHTIAAGEEGLYSLIFVRCRPPLSAVSFNVNAKFYNPTTRGPNYLSAGEAPLPTLYFVFFFLYVVAMVAWLMLCRRRKDHVHHIHHMMMALLFFKTLSLLFEAVRFHAYQTHGLTGHADGWAVVYYIFAFIKGVMRFMVILLIGSGWSLLKPYLSDKEKKVILAVLVLQVLDNTAMVVLDELSQTSPGSASWLVRREGGKGEGREGDGHVPCHILCFFSQSYPPSLTPSLHPSLPRPGEISSTSLTSCVVARCSSPLCGPSATCGKQPLRTGRRGVP